MMASTPLRKPVLSLPTPPRSPIFFTARHPIPIPPPQTHCADRTHHHHHCYPTDPSYHRSTLPSLPSLPPSPLPTAHVRLAFSSTAGWMMRIADDVVGRHPFAIPLFERVATPAEVAFISGHVHVPWAYVTTTVMRPLRPAYGEALKRDTESDRRGCPLRDNFSSCTVITKNDYYSAPRLTYKSVGLDSRPRNLKGLEDTNEF